MEKQSFQDTNFWHFQWTTNAIKWTVRLNEWMKWINRFLCGTMTKNTLPMRWMGVCMRLAVCVWRKSESATKTKYIEIRTHCTWHSCRSTNTAAFCQLLVYRYTQHKHTADEFNEWIAAFQRMHVLCWQPWTWIETANYLKFILCAWILFTFLSGLTWN